MMTTDEEREIEERFARETGQTIHEHHMAGARMLGILIGLCLGMAAGAAGYYLLKLLG